MTVQQYVTEETCSKRMSECEDCIHKVETQQAVDSAKVEMMSKIGWYILTALIIGFTGTIGATVFTAIH